MLQEVIVKANSIISNTLFINAEAVDIETGIKGIENAKLNRTL